MFSNPKKQPFIKMAALSTLVAENVEITGDIVFTGGMRIDGLPTRLSAWFADTST